jgi:hypothetical protein
VGCGSALGQEQLSLSSACPPGSRLFRAVSLSRPIPPGRVLSPAEPVSPVGSALLARCRVARTVPCRSRGVALLARCRVARAVSRCSRGAALLARCRVARAVPRCPRGAALPAWCRAARTVPRCPRGVARQRGPALPAWCRTTRVVQASPAGLCPHSVCIPARSCAPARASARPVPLQHETAATKWPPFPEALPQTRIRRCSTSRIRAGSGAGGPGRSRWSACSRSTSRSGRR